MIGNRTIVMTRQRFWYQNNFRIDARIRCVRERERERERTREIDGGREKEGDRDKANKAKKYTKDKEKW